MRIRVLSDVHIEFADFDPPAVAADVVVLAGDIAVGPAKGVAWAERHFPDVPVLMLMGNHEPYGHNLERTLERMKAAAGKTKNVHVLENDEFVLGDVRFLGATAWTDFCLFGRGTTEDQMHYCGQWINDFNRITTGGKDGPRALTPADASVLHAQTVRWLSGRLKVPFAGRTVVLTHHAPHPKSVAPQFARDLASAAFASNLERLMGPPVSLWIHGHTHMGFDYDVRGTRVLCNPRGYHPHERVQGFDPSLVVEL